jgi:5-oxoprolinase (ATP-hydrolysing) subunit A
LILLTSASRAMEAAASDCSLRVAMTFLADRAYDDDGLLVSRKLAGSVIHDRDRVLERVKRILRQGEVVTHSGSTLAMRPASILLHGDTDGAVELARAIREEVIVSGASIVPISRQGCR